MVIKQFIVQFCMDLMMLEANYGKKVRLSIIGPDAHRAFKAIKELFNNQFYE